MSDELLLGSITVRMYYKQLQFIVENSATSAREKRQKPFADKSDCVRQIFDIGVQTWQLLHLRNNPDKWNEFQQKMAHLAKADVARQVLDTMDIPELDAIAFYIKEKRNGKLTQQVLDFGVDRI